MVHIGMAFPRPATRGAAILYPAIVADRLPVRIRPVNAAELLNHLLAHGSLHPGFWTPPTTQQRIYRSHPLTAITEDDVGVVCRLGILPKL